MPILSLGLQHLQGCTDVYSERWKNRWDLWSTPASSFYTIIILHYLADMLIALSRKPHLLFACALEHHSWCVDRPG